MPPWMPKWTGSGKFSMWAVRCGPSCFSMRSRLVWWSFVLAVSLLVCSAPARAQTDQRMLIANWLSPETWGMTHDDFTGVTGLRIKRVQALQEAGQLDDQLR